jgi:hypothetical protein
MPRSDKLKNVCIIDIDSLGRHEPDGWSGRGQDLSFAKYSHMYLIDTFFCVKMANTN